MRKKVNDISFWKKRINPKLPEHYSVYLANESLWKEINYYHQNRLEEYIPKETKVLDAGCGYGRWCELFSNYVGVDFSPDFIEMAQKKYPNKRFMIARLEDLPFQDKEFDWAFCVSMKKMVIDNLGIDKWLEMEKELKRVAKKILILEYEYPKEVEIISA
jgi:ubiquinone/menaquinone biosynthesis C-methylase UbiE